MNDNFHVSKRLNQTLGPAQISLHVNDAGCAKELRGERPPVKHELQLMTLAQEMTGQQPT